MEISTQVCNSSLNGFSRYSEYHQEEGSSSGFEEERSHYGGYGDYQFSSDEAEDCIDVDGYSVVSSTVRNVCGQVMEATALHNTHHQDNDDVEMCSEDGDLPSCYSLINRTNEEEDEDEEDYEDDDDEYDEEAMDADDYSDCTELRELKRQYDESHSQRRSIGGDSVTSGSEMLRIRFPFQSISIRISDYLCLREKDFLNDTLVDFYLNHIAEHLLPDEPNKRVTVLPSLFWHNLAILQCVQEDEGLWKTKTKEEQMKIRFGDVLDFVDNFDLIDVDYIVIPVNEWDHWSLAIVCHPFTKDARIVCFDSQMTDDHSNLYNAAALIDEFLKYMLFTTTGKWNMDEMKCIVPQNVTQQTNGIDCGVYILEYARRFLLAPPSVLDNFDFAKEYADFCVLERKDMEKAVLSLLPNKHHWRNIFLRFGVIL